MRRLSTNHDYHDAQVRAVEFAADECLVFEVELCGCSDQAGATVHLSFHGVRNPGAVRSFIARLLQQAAERGRIAVIIGLARDDDRRFLLDFDQGALYIEAKRFTET